MRSNVAADSTSDSSPRMASTGKGLRRSVQEALMVLEQKYPHVEALEELLPLSLQIVLAVVGLGLLQRRVWPVLAVSEQTNSRVPCSSLA